MRIFRRRRAAVPKALTGVHSPVWVDYAVHSGINWDSYFAGIAEAVSRRASCPRATVGAVIVTDDNRIVSTGYNGAPAGEPHCFEVGCDVVDDHCQRALHAEVNAVAWAARHGTSIAGCRIYVLGRGVCRECMKVLQAAGVRVVARVEQS